MTDASLPAPLPPEAAAPRALLCPGCGYDLRGAAGERCSECGLAVDRASLERSGFPWAHRASVGRVRAFFSTLWLVTIDAERLKLETARPQSPRDAAAFRRWVAAALCVAFSAAAAVTVAAGGVEDLALPGDAWLEWYEADLLIPWSAGITLAPTLFACALVLGFYVAGSPRSIFRTRGLPPDYADTVEAIGDYAAAPLVFLLPATAGYAAVVWLDTAPDVFGRDALEATAALASSLLLLLAVGGTVYRTGQWRARTTHRGYPTGFLAMGELLLRWAVGVAVLAFVVPWCVGFAWVFLDSFRR